MLPDTFNNICSLARCQAGQLILAVLDERLDADAALMAWPRVSDKSLGVAYQALLHFSVDQTGYHQTEPYYADVQLAWLQELAETLVQGHPLPYASQAGYGRQTRFYWKPPLWWLWLLNQFNRHSFTTSVTNLASRRHL